MSINQSDILSGDDLDAAMEDIRGMKIAELTTTAAEYGLKFPGSFKKADLINALEQALRGEDMGSYKLPETSEAPVIAPKSVNEIQERVAKAKSKADEAEALRIEAEKSKPKKVSWAPTSEELVQRHSKLGYATGVLAWALNRLQKESAVVEDVILGMGESLDRESLSLAKEALIEGYSKSWDQFRMPSPALKSVADDGFMERVFAEILTIRNDFQLLSLLEEMPETVEEED